MNRRYTFVLVAVALCWGGAHGPQQAYAQSQEESSVSGDQTPSTSRPARPSDSARGQSQGQKEHSSGGEQEGYVSFPAAGVKLIRPDGYEVAEEFYGFQETSSSSSVMVTMIPAPFSAMEGKFNEQALAKAGITLLGREPVEVDGRRGVLLHCAQEILGIDLLKWSLVFGDERKTIIVTATLPRSEEATLSERLKEVVLSAKFDDTPAPDPWEDMPFTIEPSGKLKLVKGMALGKSVAFTDDGSMGKKAYESPLFIANTMLPRIPVQDKRAFALASLSYSGTRTKIRSVLRIEDVTIDGLEGYEIVADGEDAKIGTPLKVYEVILFDDEGPYVRMVGLVGEAQADEYLPEFKKMAHSFKRKRNPQSGQR